MPLGDYAGSLLAAHRNGDLRNTDQLRKVLGDLGLSPVGRTYVKDPEGPSAKRTSNPFSTLRRGATTQ